MIKFKDIKLMSLEEKIQELKDLQSLLSLKKNINVENVLQRNLNTECLKRLNMSITPNGQCFIHEKSFLSQLMENLYKDRKIYQKKEDEYAKKYEKHHRDEDKSERDRYENWQWALKILLNSAYGAVGNAYFRFFDVRLAEAITISGQLVINWIRQELNAFLNKGLKTNNIDYIIAMDTDSVYITLDKMVKHNNKQKTIDEIDKFSKDIIIPFLNKKFKELHNIMSSYEQKMSMARECIADSGVWTAKKRYALNVWDKKGVRYSYPELKIMGLDAIKSSTPELCRKRMKNIIRLVTKGDEKKVHQYIKLFRNRFNNTPFEDIAWPRRANKINNYIDSKGNYKSGTPIHYRGSIVFNALLKQKNLDKVYQLIEEGDKIKFCYMKIPNPTQENVLCIKDVLPKEFNLEKYIDYDMQFEKVFLSPMDDFLSCIGWHTTPQLTLMDLMKGN